MKSCFGILILASLLALILGGGGLMYYLSATAKFTRKDKVEQVEPKPAARPGQAR